VSTSAAAGESTFYLDLLPNSIDILKAIATPGDGLAKKASEAACDKDVSAGQSSIKAPHKCELNARTKALTALSLQPPGIPNASGGATAINPPGTCIVGHQDNGFFTPFHAFRWTEAGGTVDLGTLDTANNATRSSFATAVDSACTTVVGFSEFAGGGVTQHAFRWTQASGLVDLGAPASPSRSSRGLAVSATGDVIVGDAEFTDNNTISGFRNGAFRWSGNVFQDLGALEPGFFSLANAVSADGGVIVGQGGVSITVGGSSTNGSRAFRWTQAQGLQPIGPLPGHTHAAAIAVSDNGKIVVGTSAIGSLTRGNLGYNDGAGAFRWTEATGLQDLRQLLVGAGVDMTGITLVSVTAMSRDGQFIAGRATTPQTGPGETRSFIAHYCDSSIGAACVSFGSLRADFDGDERADILWRNGSTGDDAIWQMDSINLTASALIPTVGDTTWRIHAIGDFDADGKADILWRHSSGQNAIWLMDGFLVSNAALIPAVPDVAWQIVAVGDFNADGASDILWRNSSTGDNAIWLMDGFNVLASALITRVADTNWTVAKVGDFDNDGRTDILWRNTTTGENAIWLMNGTALVASQLIATVPITWSVAAVADYDANGKADILWRNAATGENAIWLMEGFTIQTAQFIPGVPDAAWTIVGAADHNGDDKADILWRNTATGDNAIWLMNGVTLSNSALIPAVPDSNWRIVGP
jgi:probable HAF family extracellular repeat protein